MKRKLFPIKNKRGFDMKGLLMKIKDKNVEGKILFTLSIFAVLFMIIFENSNSYQFSLYLAFSFLFLMFALFLWNRRDNKLILLGGSILYILLATYWFGKV